MAKSVITILTMLRSFWRSIVRLLRDKHGEMSVSPQTETEFTPASQTETPTRYTKKHIAARTAINVTSSFSDSQPFFELLCKIISRKFSEEK